jgi:hypothetical protein
LKERPKSAAFHPYKRYSTHYQKIIKENPGSLLISGSVLQEAIAKTFSDFLREYKTDMIG